MTTTFDEMLAFTEKPYLPRARARPFVKWAGGKRAVIPEIATRLPDSFNAYWEPFIGGGAVFFALDSRIKTAYLSDVNAELMLTYGVIQNTPNELIEVLSQHAERHDKDYYYRVRGMTDLKSGIEVAARFIYLNKTCYNGLYRVNKAGHFNAPIGSYKNPAICDSDNLHAASEVLNGAWLAFGDFQRVAPGDGDFIYCDPPYDGTYAGYDKDGFDEGEQRRLRDAVAQWSKLGAYVMVSNSDTALTRSLYGSTPFEIHEITAPRNISADENGRGKVGELLITTYPCQA
jgi:DNA adenine methylase